MDTRQKLRTWLPSVALCMLALLVIPPTPSPTYGDEWVNYYETPDIVYDVAVEADPVEQARNSFKYIVWIATEVGVFRIDNDKGTYIRYTFANGLSHNSVKSILVDSAKNKWFGTMTGEINLFDGINWTITLTPDITPVNAIAIDAAGLWLARGDFVTTILGLGGVHMFDGNEWLVFNRNNFGLASNYAEALTIDSAGNIWIGTCPPPLFPWNLFQTGGLHKYDGTTLFTYKKANGLANNNVFDIAEDSSGILWIATLFGGVSRFDGTNWTTYNSTNSGLASDNVLAVTTDSGHQWFGTNAGASVFDGTTWTTYDTATSGLVNNMVHAVRTYETRNGSREIWFGTGNGVSRYKPGSNKWKTFAFDGILNTTYNAVAVDGSNTKWFATDAGASMFDGTTWTLYNTGNSGLVSDIVRSVAVDGSGNAWFATDAGASRFDGTTWTNYNTGNSGLASDNLYAVATDGSGNIWFGTDAGASMFDGSAWATYTVDDGLASSAVSAIAVDGSNVWFATDAGASTFDGSAWTTYTVDDGLASNTVTGIAANGSGSVWFATDAGASTFDGSTWTTYDTGSASLITNTVYCVSVDTAGNIWLGTNAGASRFDGTTWTHFSVGSGIGGRYARAAAAAGNGDVWFTTDSGVSGYIKSVVVPPVTPPAIVDPPTSGPGLVPDTSGIGCFIQSLFP